MSIRSTVTALLVAVLVPGCAWFNGDDGGESAGPSFFVSIKNSGQHEVKVKLEVIDSGLLEHSEAFTVAGGKTEERDVEYKVNGTKMVRVGYTLDANGTAASGTQENSFDPSQCAGTYRVTFEVRADDRLTLVGNHGECDVGA